MIALYAIGQGSILPAGAQYASNNLHISWPLTDAEIALDAHPQL